MGTANTSVDMAVKPETSTWATIGTSIPDGTDASGQPKFKLEPKAVSNEKAIETAEKEGQVLIKQTFSYDLAGSIDGIKQIIPDEEEAVNIFNVGLKIKRNTRIKALLEEQNENGELEFQPVEGNFDLRDLLAETSARRNLSPTDKALKVLVGMGFDRSAALAFLQTKGQAAASQE